MVRFFNKQRDLLIAYPLAILFFVGLIGGMSFFLRTYHAGDYIAAKDGHDMYVPSPTLSAAERSSLPIATYIPVRKTEAEQLAVTEAHAAVVLDVASGTILYEKNATEKRAIASTTKMLTAMVVIDRIRNLDEYVTIPESVLTIEGTKIGCITSVICNGERMIAGERLRVRDLMVAMLMDSANDAATALAIHVAGSEEAMAELLNLRMRELGLVDSHFCRPSGLELDIGDEGCYSTAYDIGRVVVHLLTSEKYKEVWEILSRKEQIITSEDGTLKHELASTNRLLGEVPYVIGGKTGFTPRAGYSLVMATQKPNSDHRVVAVVLNDYSRFDDVQMMSEWAFDNFIWQ